jgi:predicted GTPase
MACDFTALELIYKFYTRIPEINNEFIIEGINLAFLYLRSLFDLKVKATNSINKQNDVSRFRYNLLKKYFIENQLFEPYKIKTSILVDAYDKWEEKIDMLMVLFLNEKLKKKLYNTIKKSKKDVFKKEILYELLRL